MNDAKTWRVLPPNDPRYTTRIANGRPYTGTPGVAMSVPAIDARVLCANGWTLLTTTGPTSERPTGDAFAFRGARFYDETIGSEIVFDGTVWRTPMGAAV